MQWLAQNVVTILALSAFVGGLITTWVLYGADIRQLKKDSERQGSEHDELAREVRKHQSDTSLHLDPNRDKKIWEDFQRENARRFDRLEEKIEKLMLVAHPAPPM